MATSDKNQSTLNIWRVVDRDANQSVWNYITQYTNVDGKVLLFTNRFVEIATGLHYYEDGQWKDTDVTIEAQSGQAVANKGPHKAVFADNLLNGIQVTTPDGVSLRSQPMGISYSDGENQVLIAELQSCEGVVIPPNQVLYKNAFTDFDADILYTYTKAGVEQDLIIRQQPPDIPEGLKPDLTRIQLLTEFFNTPDPTITDQAFDVEQGVKLTDEVLQFGSMQMGNGQAFSIGDDNQKGASEIGVAKQYLKLEGRNFLFEEVPVSNIKDDLEQLPKDGHASTVKAKEKKRYIASNKITLPKRITKDHNGKRMMTASLSPKQKGFVLDYSLLSSTSNFTFDGNTTYYASGTVSLTGTNVFQSGTIVKLTNGASLTFSGTGKLLSSGTDWRPIVITSKDDNSVGTTITGSSGSPSASSGASAALSIGSSVSITVTNMRILYAQKAIELNAGTFPLYDLQIVNCLRGISAIGSTYAYLRNVLFANVLTNFYIAGTTGITLENSTIDNSLYFIGVSGSGLSFTVAMTNSILANVTNRGPSGQTVTINGNYNGFYNATVMTNSSVSSAVEYFTSSSPFSTVGAGQHYLTTGSTFFSAGTTAIDSGLQGMLTNLTTEAPIYLTNTPATAVRTDTTLSPQVRRNTGTPDLGYHYKPLDYMTWSFGVTNATLLLTNGVNIGYYNGDGIYAFDGTTVYCQGSPLNYNRFVDYAVVQEMPTIIGTSGNSGGNCFVPYRYLGYGSPAKFRFTEFVRLQGGGYNLYENGYFIVSSLDVRDCIFRQGATYINTSLGDHLFVNNLWEGVKATLYMYSSSTMGLYNNLMNNGGLDVYSAASASYFLIKDNAFQKCNLSDDSGTTTHSYNAFINSSTSNFTNNSSSISVTNYTWQTGALGNYYQATNSTFINAGSRYATNAGLYHYTTLTNQTKEASTMVDIGYHYIALVNGLPADTDGDGVADYLEDANGNGTVDSAETDWQSATDLGLRVTITRPRSGSNL